jgi:hypothetical protein
MSYFLTRRVAKAEELIDDLKVSVSNTNAVVSVINGSITNLVSSNQTILSNINSLVSANQVIQSHISTIQGNIISINTAIAVAQTHDTVSSSTTANANVWTTLPFFSNISSGTYLFIVSGQIEHSSSSPATLEVRFANITDSFSLTAYNYIDTLVVGQPRNGLTLSQIVSIYGTVSVGTQVYHNSSSAIVCNVIVSYMRIK